jgi:hypothetical protein
MPTESSSKPARDWSVNTSQEPPAKPAAATRPSAVVRPKVLAKPAAAPTATPAVRSRQTEGPRQADPCSRRIH